MWVADDELIGTGPDILRRILADLDISLTTHHMGNWKRCLAEVKHGSIDMVAAAYYTADRAVFMDYTQELLSPDPVVLFVRKGKEFDFESHEDLAGKTMGSLFGDSHGQAFDLFARKHLHILQSNHIVQNFGQLELDRIDFFPGGLYANEIRLRVHGYEKSIVPLRRPLSVQQLRFGVSKQSGCLPLLKQLDRGLKRYRTQGVIDRSIEASRQRYLKQHEAQLLKDQAEK